MDHFDKHHSNNFSKIRAGNSGASVIRTLFDYQSPFRLVIVIALSVFIGETFVMIVLSLMRPSSVLVHALFDSTMLIILISPVLYFFIFRPLVQHFNDLSRAEKAVRDSELKIIQAEKMSTLGVLVSATAHELQNPNGVIALNLPILKDYLQELLPMLDKCFEDNRDYVAFRMPYQEIRREIYELIDNIENSSGEITSFVANLKEYSQSREEKRFESVNLTSVVEQTLVICGNQINKTIKSFAVNIPEDLPPVVTDAQALKQVLINFLINATQAANKKDSWLKLSAVSGNTWREHTIIEISDNGCGMDEITQQKIFDPLFTTKSEESGTGLGLYLCYDLVDGLGGRIEVESELAKGTTFRVILPDRERGRFIRM